MNVPASLLARLAVYAAALFVVAMAQLPGQAPSAVSALRTGQPDVAISPVRYLLAGILLAGILIEVLRRRPLWR